MVIFLLLIQLVLCSAILYREIVRLQFRNLATSFFVLVYSIVYVLEPLVLHLFYGGARSIVRDVPTFFDDPYVYYLFSAYGISLLVACLLFGRTSTAETLEPLPEGENRSTEGGSAWLALLIILGVLMFLWSTGMTIPELLVASRFAWVEAGGYSVVGMTVSSYFTALVGIYAYRLKAGKKTNLWLVALCLAMVVFHGIITKDRKWVLFLLSGWFAGHYEVSGRKVVIRPRMAVALGLLFFILVISQFIRDVAPRYLLGNTIDFGQEVTRWQSFLIEYGDISFFYRSSLEAIHQNVNHDFLIPLGIVRRTVFFFLPKSYSAGLKVEDISATFSDVVGGEDIVRRGNIPPGLFGLFVVSFGWLASLFLIPLLAFLLKKLDRMLRAGRGILRESVLSLYLFSVVLAFRGDDSSATYYIISTLLVLLVGRLLGRSGVATRPTGVGQDSRPATP